MRTSRIDEKLQFNTEFWVVSIVNTNKRTDPQSQLFDGHNALLVEGLQNVGPGLYSTRLFVGYYGIGAMPYDDQKESTLQRAVNVKGAITSIVIEEAEEYAAERSYRYSQAYSKLASAENVRAMILSIKADHARTEAAKVGHGDYLPYQALGLDSLFAQAGRGHNCASWCADKLNIALHGVNANGEPNQHTESGKKPSLTARGLGACVIL